MKKALQVLIFTLMIASCNNNGGESGSTNDGVAPVDANGGLADTANTNNTPAIDTAMMENRVDINKRDTIDKLKKH